MNSTSDYLENIDDVDAGWTHSLTLDLNSLVWAWGRNEEGQLGDAQQSSQYYSATPVMVHDGEMNTASGYLEYIIAISAGRSGLHSLAVDANGYAYGWGYNKYGQCGNDESNNSKLTPVRVHRGEQPQDPNDPNEWLKHIIDICAGADQSIALEKDDPTDPNFSGSVYTWGTNWWGDEDYEQGWIDPGYGLLGTGSNVALEDAPVKVHGVNDVNFLEHIVAVAAGWDHCMALENDDPLNPSWQCPACKGRVYTWGNNGVGYGGGPSSPSVGGRLGDGTTTSRSTPVLVLKGQQETSTSGYLEHIVAIAAGEGHSMALDNNGNVYTWGDNQFGQLGNGTNDPCTTPVRVINPQDPNLPLSGIVAISAGHWHSLAIDANGVIWTWGKGSAGRLGLGNKVVDCSIPHPIPVVYNLTQETFAFAIQTAIDDANDAGDILEASPGTYYEDVDFRTKTITLRSADPNNAAVVEDTVIQGSGGWYIPAVQFTANPNSRLSGFTIANNDYGIKCDSSSPTISNSVIANCAGHGLYCVNNSAIEVTNCTISGNGGSASPVENGISCSSSEIILTNCLIAGNGGDGVYCNQSTAAITGCAVEGNAGIGLFVNTGSDFVLNRSIVCDNGWDGLQLQSNNSVTLTDNWIYRNGRTHETYRAGVWLNNNNASVPLVRNNTIFGNPTYGIEVTTPQTDPNILNCIIYANGSGDLYGRTFDTVNYCCLQNPRGTNNITSDPCFVDPDVNDFHLAANSPCIDAGDPDFEPEPNETDIDGEPRVMDGDANDTVIVDMGADEFYWSEADYSGDGFVNFIDYALLTLYWREAGVDYNDVFLYGDSNSVGLKEFCEDWLWTAGWLTGAMPLMAGRSGGEMTEALSLQVAPYELTAIEKKPLIAEPVDVKKLLDWLAKIWLDPEVRERIDAEAWLKLYESVKDLEPITK